MKTSAPAPDGPTFRMLERWLGLTSVELAEAWSRSTSDHYHRTRHGVSGRALQIPEGALYTVQAKIQRQMLRALPIAVAAHGGVPGRSLLTHAAVHLPQARSLLVMDIQKAYHQVDHELVRDALRRRLKKMWLEQGLDAARRRTLATTLAVLTTTHEGLPMGAPTSAALFNLVAAPFDEAMARLVQEKLGTAGRYSRYLDDIAVSSARGLPLNFRRHVRAALRAHGLGRCNDEKTRRMDRRDGDEPCVMGVVATTTGFALAPAQLARHLDALRALKQAPHRALARRQAQGVGRFLKMVYGARLPDEVRALLPLEGPR